MKNVAERLTNRRSRYRTTVRETFVEIKIEPLSEGGFLATSREVPGLVAQGRTIAETMEIAQDVARKIVESCIEHGDPVPRVFRSMTTRTVNVRVPVMVG